jgi:hypothetical protein
LLQNKNLNMTRKTIAGNSAEIWHQINTDFVTGNNLHDYHVLIQHENHDIELDMVSSPGGSFEGGYDVTTLSAPLPLHTPFRFAIFPEDFLNKIGKLFGMQDVITGYKELDENVIVQTNEPETFKRVFANDEVRKVFQTLSGYSFRTIKHENREVDHLELTVQHTLAGAELLEVFNAFTTVLASL